MRSYVLAYSPVFAHAVQLRLLQRVTMVLTDISSADAIGLRAYRIFEHHHERLGSFLICGTMAAS